MRRLVFPALVTALVAGLIALPAHASPPLNYVALGDSYSAASGNTPADPTAPVECLRSTVNYPHVIAAATGAALTDVSCGGADTSDYRSSQYPDAPPQLDALSAATQLVTMTIGGNDSNVFVDTIIDCGEAGLLSLGQGSPCKDQYGSSFADTINNTTYPALVKALRAVHKRAPHAQVAILSYPWIMPATGGCFPQMPIASGDVPYVHGIQATLNNAVHRAARKTGSVFVNLNGPSTGHDACQPSGVRWIEPVVGGDNPVIVHPNAFGEAQMAKYTEQALNLG